MSWRLCIMAWLLLSACARDRSSTQSGEDLLRDGRAALARGQVDRAVALLGRAVEKRPDHLESRLGLAKALGAARRTREAERCLRDGLAREGRAAPLWMALGKVLASQGKHDQAVLALGEARLYAPKDMEVVLALGRIYEEHGHADAAGSLYRSSLGEASVPSRIQLHRRLARLATGREQHAEALAELRRALALAPKRGDLLGELGVALRSAGRSAEARTVLRDAVRLRPQDGQACLQLGLAHREMEEHREAVEALVEAVRLLPGRAAPLVALCESHLAVGARDQAYGTCVRALALAPANARVQWRMVPLYLERGLVEPAGELLGQLLGARGHDPVYWELVAQVAEGRGDHGAAQEAWAKAYTLRPKDLLLRRRLGFAARRAGDYARATRHLEAVLVTSPDDYDALVHLAIAAELSGLRPRATWALGRAERLAPKRPEAFVYLAWLAQRQGRPEQALERARHADKLAGGTSAPALDVLASAYGALGRKDEERAVLLRAQALPLGAKDRDYLAARRAALEAEGRRGAGGAPASRPRPSSGSGNGAAP